MPRDLELPLGAVNGIAVAPDGRIFCAVQFYSRIQVYAEDGRYLTARHVAARGGDFRIRMTQEGRLLVATARGRMRYVYGTDLDLLSEKTLPDLDLYDSLADASVVYSASGVRYELRNFLMLYPRVTRTGESGRRDVVVRMPLYLWPIMGPFPAWALIPLGLVLRMRLGRG